MHGQLDDFEGLAADLSSCPTHLAVLISDALEATGSVDASGTGMGGVWFTVDGNLLVWREPFPKDIVHHLVSYHNPTGDLTNSNFELAGIVAHQDILAQEHDIWHASMSILNDNIPLHFLLHLGVHHLSRPGGLPASNQQPPSLP
jgi:hypothetical protein